LLAAIGLIDDENPGAAAALFGLQHQFRQPSQHTPVVRPTKLRQETNYGCSMPRLRANRSGRLRGRHATHVHNEGSYQPNQEPDYMIADSDRSEKSLDPRQSILHHHDRDSFLGWRKSWPNGQN
jgi:hypothetical protein